LPRCHRGFQLGQFQQHRVELVRADVQRHVLELEDHVQFEPGRIGEPYPVLDGDAGHLAHGEDVRVTAGEDLAVHLLQNSWLRGPLMKNR